MLLAADVESVSLLGRRVLDDVKPSSAAVPKATTCV